MSLPSDPRPNQDVADLHARDGHLTMLTLDRFDCGELETNLHEAVMDHLDRCASCATRFDAMHRATPPLQPPVSTTGGGMWRWAVAGAGLAMAASLILAILPEPQQASLRPASEPTLTASPYTTSAATEQHGPLPALDIRLFAGDRRLASGDVVSTDEALHLEVRVEDRGWLAIVVDAVESPDAHPDEGAGDTGGIEPESTARMLLAPRALEPEAPLRIAHDVALEGVVTEEHILAIFCPEPFVLDPHDVAGFDVAEVAGLPEGCTSRSIHYAPWGRIAAS